MVSAKENALEFAPVLLADRQSPQDIRSEEEVLGALLLDSNGMDLIADYALAPEMFYLSAHQEIFRAIAAIHVEGKSYDPTSVIIWLNDRGILDKVGGQNRILGLIESIVSAVHIDICAESIKDKFYRREALSSFNNASKVVRDTSRSLEEVLDASEQMIFAVGDSARTSDQTIAESLTTVFERVATNLDFKGTASLKLGYHDLDEVTGGFFPKNLVIAAGRTAMGKSHFGVAAAYEIARQGLPVVFFSLEMTKEEVVERLWSRHARVDSKKIRRKTLSNEDLDLLYSSSGTFAALSIEVDDNPSLTLSQIRSTLRRTASRAKDRIGLVVIDYIQLMGGGSVNRVQELDEILKGLKAIAKEFDTTILGLAQVNREVEGKSDKRPSMANIRESGAIEMTADQILLLYRDEYYNPETEDKGTMEITIAKNRNGESGFCKLLFQPQYSLFLSVATGYSGHQESYSPTQPATPRKPPSTPPKAPNQPKKEPAKREPQPVASEPSNHPFDDAVAESIPPIPDEVDGFRKGDRVEITLDNFDQKMQKQIRREDGFVDGRTGVVIGFKWCTIGIPAYDLIVSLDGVENKSKSFPAVYLKKIDDSECDDF